MRIAFVGLPLAALLLAEDGHEIVWAGLCRRGAIGTRRLRRRIGRERVVVTPDLARRASEIAASRPELLVSWFWTKNIPPAVRELAPLGAIGVHPSLLPRHRGPDPTFWAIETGDAVTGVTAHLLEDAYDTGAILGQRTLAIEPSWSAWDLARALDRPSLRLLRDVTRAYAQGAPPRPTAQNESLATLAPAPDDTMLELSWSAPAEAILRRIRALSPWPGAFTQLGADIVTITQAAIAHDVPRALDVGEAYVRKDGVAVVRAGDGAGIALLAGRLELPEDDAQTSAQESIERILDTRALADLVRAAIS
jgi:methionyl-tRNA formyltransferase